MKSQTGRPGERPNAEVVVQRRTRDPRAERPRLLRGQVARLARAAGQAPGRAGVGGARRRRAVAPARRPGARRLLRREGGDRRDEPPHQRPQRGARRRTAARRDRLRPGRRRLAAPRRARRRHQALDAQELPLQPPGAEREGAQARAEQGRRPRDGRVRRPADRDDTTARSSAGSVGWTPSRSPTHDQHPPPAGVLGARACRPPARPVRHRDERRSGHFEARRAPRPFAAGDFRRRTRGAPPGR
jgi:hypothetical protein